jgi:hypothetical protein
MVLEVLDFNLVCDTSYPDRFPEAFLISPKKCFEVLPQLGHSCFFPNHFNASAILPSDGI